MAITFYNATVDAYVANLVSLWTMQEVSSTTRADITTGARTVTSGTTVGSETGPGGAHLGATLRYDDMSYFDELTRANTTTYPTLNNFTLSVWFNSLYGNNEPLIGIGDPSIGYNTGYIGSFNFIAGCWDSQLILDYWDPNYYGPGVGESIRLTSNTVTLNSGTWYHVGLTRSGSTITWYYNGGTAGTSSSSVTLGNVSAGYMGIGCNFYNGWSFPYEHLNGALSQVAVWDTALSGAAMSALYNSGSGLLDAEDEPTWIYGNIGVSRSVLRNLLYSKTDGQRNMVTHSRSGLDA